MECPKSLVRAIALFGKSRFVQTCAFETRVEMMRTLRRCSYGQMNGTRTGKARTYCSLVERSRIENVVLSGRVLFLNCLLRCGGEVEVRRWNKWQIQAEFIAD